MLCKLRSVYTVWYYTEGLKLLYSKRPIFAFNLKKLHRAENFYTDAVSGVCDKYAPEADIKDCLQMALSLEILNTAPYVTAQKL